MLASLRDNMRVRGLRSDITAIETVSSRSSPRSKIRTKTWPLRFAAQPKIAQVIGCWRCAQNSYIGGELNSLKAS